MSIFCFWKNLKYCLTLCLSEKEITKKTQRGKNSQKNPSNLKNQPKTMEESVQGELFDWNGVAEVSVAWIQ